MILTFMEPSEKFTETNENVLLSFWEPLNDLALSGTLIEPAVLVELWRSSQEHR